MLKSTFMKRGIVLVLFACLNFTLSSCQEKETYWVVDGLTKENGEPMTGITLGYMEALASRQYHIYKNGDELEFMYPVAKKVKTDDLKSLTDSRLLETGQLVDSVYAVKVSGNKLSIKFTYIGTAQDDKRFSLNFVQLDKDKFYSELKNVQNERKKITDKIKKVEVSKLDLTIPKPAYFNKEDLTALSPMQGIDLFLGVKSDEMQPTVQSFTVELDENKKKAEFSKLGVDIPAKQNYAAKFDGVDFNGLEFVTSAENKTQAIKLTRDDLDKKYIVQLFHTIDKSQPNAAINYIGLPDVYQGEMMPISNSISVSWKAKDKMVKLIVDIPKELYEKETDIKVFVPENGTAADIKKVFLHYVNLLNKPKVSVVVISTDFESDLFYDRGSRSDMGDYLK